MERRKGLWPFGLNENPTPLQRYLLKLAEICVLMVFIAIGIFVFIRVAPYVLPFGIGFLIAVSLLPLARVLEKLGAPRKVSIIMALVVVLGGIVGLLGLLIEQGAEEAISLSQALPHYMNFWEKWIERATAQGMIVYAHLPTKVVAAMQSTITSAIDQSRQFVISLLSGFVGEIAVLPDLFVVIVISVVAAYFFMIERESMLDGLNRFLPPGWGPKLEEVAHDVGKALAGLLRAQAILILVTSVISVIGLVLMGIPYALIIGLAIGLTGWVPIFGSGVVTLPWAIGAFAMGNYVLAIKILLLQAVSSLVRHTIEPKILASNMGLGTFATLFGMYVGLTSIGFIGLLLGPIMMIAIRSLIRERMFGDFFAARPPLYTKETRD